MNWILLMIGWFGFLSSMIFIIYKMKASTQKIYKSLDVDEELLLKEKEELGFINKIHTDMLKQQNLDIENQLIIRSHIIWQTHSTANYHLNDHQ